GLKEPTVWSRLAQARRLLRERLARRGVTLTAVLAAAALAPDGYSAPVRGALVDSTVRAAGGAVPVRLAVLLRGAPRMTLTNRWQLVTALALVLGAAGFGLWAGPEPAGGPGQQPEAAGRTAPEPEKRAEVP